MNREAVEALITAVFTAKKTLIAYFGAERSAIYDYDLCDERSSDWALVDRGDTLVHDLQVPEDWTEDDEQAGWTYSGHIRGGFYEGKDFSLALVDIQQGGAGCAYILDNSKRLPLPWKKA